MASITIDGLDEEIFRRNIEAMLRVGEADRAAVKLRALLEPYVGAGRPLPLRFLDVTAADFRFEGWDKLGESLARNDLPRHPISALTIAVSDAEALGVEPPADEAPGPLIATSHFTDEAYMFSQCAEGDLLDGYSFYGCEWHGGSTHMDTALVLRGVEDLYRAVAGIEAELIASPQPPLDMIRAGSLASCYLAVLLHQAVRDTIRAHGVPRPLCVMAGNEGVYPYFDAPVIGSLECIDEGLVVGASMSTAPAAQPAGRASAEPVLETVGGGDGFAYGRLGELTRRTEKKPVLELAEAERTSAAELLERAGEERLSGPDEAGAALDDLLAQRGPSHPLFAPPPPVDAPMAEPESRRAAEPAFPPAGTDPFASPGSFPEVAETPDPAAPPAWSAPTAWSAQRPDEAEPREEPADRDQASGPAEPEVPVRAAASHSLRARFAEAPAAPPPPAPRPLWSRALSTVVRWLHAVFG